MIAVIVLDMFPDWPERYGRLLVREREKGARGKGQGARGKGQGARGKGQGARGKGKHIQ